MTTDKPNQQDYAAVKAKALLDKFPSLDSNHRAALAPAIRTAILEAMRDQRYACVEAIHALPDSVLIPRTVPEKRDALSRIVSAVQNATPEGKQK